MSTSYSIRQPLGVVGDHHAVQLPGDGADVVLPDRDRVREHGGAQAEREGPVRVDAARASCGPRPGCPTACSTSCTATRPPSTALLDHPDVRAVSFVGSTPIARYVYETGTRTASGCRPSAARRTTWSCCPTPTSTWPPTPRSTPASARRASGAWRSRRSSRSSRSPTSSSRRSRRAWRTLRTGDGRRGCRHGPAGHRGAPRQGRVLPRRRCRRRRGAGGRRPRRDGRRRATASGSARRCSTASTPEMSIYTDEIFGPVLSVLRVADVRRGAGAGEREPVRQRHRDLHQRRRRGAPVPERGRGRHGRRQRADPGADGVLLLRRLEGLAVRRHPRARRRGRALLHPRQGRHVPLARPEPRRHQPGLPTQT